MRNISEQRKKRVPLLYFGLCFTLLFVSPGHSVFSQSDGPLIIGTELGYPPYSFINQENNPDGFNVELSRALGKVLGREVEVRIDSWADIKNALATGEIDLIAGMYYSPQRDNDFDFSPPYAVVQHTAFVREDGPRITDASQLQDKAIIVMRGDIMHDYLLQEDLTDTFLLRDTIADALRALAAGEGDYVLAARLPGLYRIEELDLKNIEDTGVIILSSEYSLAVREGDTMLLGNVSQGLAILKNTGRYKEIHDTWLQVLDGQKVTFKDFLLYIALLAVPVGIILIAVLFWIWTLRRKVADRTRILETEIAQRSNAEKELRFQSALLNQIQDMITATDLDGKITYVNEAETRILGKQRDELIGSHVSGFGEDTTRGASQQEIIDKTRELGEWRGFVVNYDSEGREVLLDVRTKWLRDEQDNPIGMVGISTDITELRRIEKELIQNEARLRAIFNSAQDVIYLKDKEGRYTHVNQAMEQFFETRAEQIIGKTDEELFPPEQVAEIIEIDRQVLLGRPHRGEFSRHIKSTEKIVETIKTPVWDEEGNINGLCGVTRDMTEHHRMRKQIETALEEKEVLLRELYHRTKNNMQVIASIISLRKSVEKNTRLKEVLKELENKIYSMALVHQKLYQSQDLSKIDVKEYIQDLANLILNSFNQGEQALKIHYDLKPIHCLIDTLVPLGIVINELLTNAVKHAFAERSQGNIYVAAENSGNGELVVEIADDGVGMPEDIDPERTGSIGLQIVKNVVELQLNGRVELERAGGTTWRLYIDTGSYYERV
jgi:PAS domain S-box-containing protein